MKTINEKPAKKTDASTLAIGGRFKRFGLEEEKVVRKAGIKDDKVLGQLKEIWDHYCKHAKHGCIWFEGAFEGLRNIYYSSDDVERFCLALSEFQDGRDFKYQAGMFLSALVNSGKEEEYTIHTSHLGAKISYLGDENEKTLVVCGDLGGCVGRDMVSGSILVKGNCGHQVGDGMRSGSIVIEGNAGHNAGIKMRGGSIFVKGSCGQQAGEGMLGGTIEIVGNTDYFVGSGMRGGLIIIHGNAGCLVGHGMKGGVIRIEGDYEGISDEITGGKIYHKGKLLVDK
jgi:formylmethanofuran dehydrogenase subunit C